MRNSLVAVLLVIIVVLAVGLFMSTRNRPVQGVPLPVVTIVQAIPSPFPTQAAPTRPRSQAISPSVGRANPAHARYLPDPRLTPGDALDVSANDICQSGYSSKVRDVPESVKNEVYLEYGITSRRPGEYEVDHLISLELGGSNSVKNLWPESYTGPWNAHEKDRLEDHLHAEVCNGKLDLKTAQREISTDWITAYVKYFGQPAQ